MNLGTVDFVILVIIAAFAIWGIFKGFISQLVSIISLIAGVWCAFKFSNLVAHKIAAFLNIGETAVYILSFALILIGILILGTFISKLLEKIIHLTMLGWLNGLLGFLFAGFKIIIAMGIIIYLVRYANFSLHMFDDDFFHSTKILSLLTDLSAKIFPFIEKIVSA
ncbi:MAG: CvpA family protein [Bacteroidales bacterium]|jgi:membrane protein required for colicin V production|nr:CvpA family protein [Bacteroidales bacterium]